MDSTIARTDNQSTASGATVARYCLAIAGAVTAVIHFAVAGEHFAEYWLFGAFMLVVGWLQVLWSVGIVVRPWRWVLWSGAVLNAGVIGVYIVTRTVGDVVGPTPHDVEPLGFGDGLCTVAEAVVVVGCLWLLASKLDWQVRRSQLFAVPGVAAVAAVVLLSVALVAGGPEMVMTDAATTPAAGQAHHMHMAMSSSKADAVKLATASPAGDITMPSGMQMEPGMRMAGTAMCAARPTLAQQTAAVRLVDASWRDARRFRSLSVAQAAGYVPITPVGLPVVHYLNYNYYLSTMRGGPVLNTAKPQSLVYAHTAKGAVLVAAMYIAPPDRVTPRPGGCLTQWHEHTNLCQTNLGVVVGLATAARTGCPAGSTNRVTPPMMHVWFVPVPGGPTAIDASDAAIVRAAEQARGSGNGPA